MRPYRKNSVFITIICNILAINIYFNKNLNNNNYKKNVLLSKLQRIYKLLFITILLLLLLGTNGSDAVTLETSTITATTKLQTNSEHLEYTETVIMDKETPILNADDNNDNIINSIDETTTQEIKIINTTSGYTNNNNNNRITSTLAPINDETLPNEQQQIRNGTTLSYKNKKLTTRPYHVMATNQPAAAQRLKTNNVAMSYTHSKHHHEHHWGPFFEEQPHLNGSVLTGTTTHSGKSATTLQIGIHLGTEAVLNCRVGMLRDKTVMWVRRTKDKVSLLTVGNLTYSGDPRIHVKFQYPNNWRLLINPTQKDDAGLYMCQVSTHPPRVFATNVSILPPAIRVVDEHGYEVHDRYYKLGSIIDLTCQVAVTFLSTLPNILTDINSYHRKSSSLNEIVATILPPVGVIPTPIIETAPAAAGKTATFTGNTLPTTSTTLKQIDLLHQKLFWLKDGKHLPKDVTLNISSSPNWRGIRLTILEATRLHGGVYSCILMNTSSALVHVQVLNGEQHAAVQHNNSIRHKWKYWSWILPIILVIRILTQYNYNFIIIDIKYKQYKIIIIIIILLLLLLFKTCINNFIKLNNNNDNTNTEHVNTIIINIIIIIIINIIYLKKFYTYLVNVYKKLLNRYNIINNNNNNNNNNKPILSSI